MHSDPEHRHFLQRCLDLAYLPGAAVAPNPRVGAVVVHDGKIIGEGAHLRFGGPHAEVNAVASVADKSLLPFSTLYVSLEPCNHHGKTPPCTSLILEQGIRKVVVGAKDPNPLMAGKSLDFLRSKGVEVILAVSDHAFLQLNEHFLFNQQYKRTYFTLKWAESQDGKMAGLDTEGNGKAMAITAKAFNRVVHHLRHEHQGILVSARTIQTDNPSLNTRKWPGHSPFPIILDTRLSLGKEWKIFQAEKVVVLNFQHSQNDEHVQFIKIKDPINWQEVSRQLYSEAGIGSVLVEGGGILLQSMLDQGFGQSVIKAVGQNEIGAGILAPKIPSDLYRLAENGMLGLDFVEIYSPTA